MYAEFALLAALAGLVGTVSHSDVSLTPDEDAFNTTTTYTHRTSFLTDPRTTFITSVSTDVSTNQLMDDSIIRARSHNLAHHASRPVIHHNPLPQNEPGSKLGPHASVHHIVGDGHKIPHTGRPKHSPVPTEELSDKDGHKHPKRAAKSPNNAFSVLSSALSSQRHHPHPSDPVRSFRHSQQHHTPKSKVTGSKIHPVPSGNHHTSKPKVTGSKVHPVPSKNPKSPKSGHGDGGGLSKNLPKFERKHPPSPITSLPNHTSPPGPGGQITPFVTPEPTSNPHSSKISGLNNPFMHPNRPVTNSNELPKTSKKTPKDTGTGTVGHAKQVKTHDTSTKSQGNGGGFIGAEN